MDPLVMTIIIAVILLIIINYIAAQNKTNNVKNNKVVETFRVPTLEEQCSIEYFPLGKKYAPKCKGDYIFKTHYGTFNLHSTPCDFTLFSTEQEVRDIIKEYLEWNGKDKQTIKY